MQTRFPPDRRALKAVLLGTAAVFFIALSAFVYENVGYIPFRNDSMALATVVVGAGEAVVDLKPGEERPLFFWLYRNHQRYFSTSVSYPDGYHYNRQLSLLIQPGYTEELPIDDAPSPQLFLQNESLGQPTFQVVEVSSGAVSDDTVAKAIESGHVTQYYGNAVVPLQYGKAYAVTADATYSATENYSVKGTFSPEPGFTYKMLTCGETGSYGTNCGPFQFKNRDGGWYDTSGAPATP